MKLPEYDRLYDSRIYSQNAQTKIEGWRANIVEARRVGDRVWEAESLYTLGCKLQTINLTEAIGSIEHAIEIFRQEHEVKVYYQASLNLAAIYEMLVLDKQAALRVYERAAEQGEIPREETEEDSERKYVLHHIERIKRELDSER